MAENGVLDSNLTAPTIFKGHSIVLNLLHGLPEAAFISGVWHSRVVRFSLSSVCKVSTLRKFCQAKLTGSMSTASVTSSGSARV